MLKKIISLIAVCVFVSAVSVHISSASDFESYNSNTVSVTAFTGDTIAGFPTSISSSNVGSGVTVDFKIEKPDGTLSELSVASGFDGVARLQLSDFHVRMSGTYKVSAKLGTSSSYGNASTFNVLAGELSDKISSVTPTEQVVRIGREKAEIEVGLKDVFGNPISGHMVQLISSNGADSVETSSNLSDSNGRVIFSVSSPVTGVSSYSVYDLTVNKILSQRAKVVYFDSGENFFSNTKALVGSAFGSSGGPVAYLKFDDFPSSANINQSLSFTLSAKDSSDQTVTSYNGTVVFSVISGSSTGVILPSTYTFTAQDMGSHPFALALSFTSPGTYIIEAKDLSDPMIFGTSNITVSSSQSGVGSSISITNPSPGSYSNNVQVVSGSATPGSSLSIYDNNVKIGTASANQSGLFSFTTGLLTDGTHEFYVAVTNEGGTILSSSDKVVVNIDTTPPKIDKIEVSPVGSVPAGADVEIKVYSSETSLSQALIEINGAVYEMKVVDGLYYSSKFKTPLISGSYPMKFTLVDALGNRAKLEDPSYILTVGDGSSQQGVVSDVSSLIAAPGNGKVTLSWTAPSSGSLVQFYRIYYGLSANQLIYVMDTWNASTSWYVPDLQNGKEYFFAVVAVDNKGTTSSRMSNIVSGIPSDIYPDTVGFGTSTGVWNGTAGGENISDMPKDPSDSGPEIVWLFFSAVLGGIFYSYFSTRKKAEEFERF